MHFFFSIVCIRSSADEYTLTFPPFGPFYPRVCQYCYRYTFSFYGLPRTQTLPDLPRVRFLLSDTRQQLLYHEHREKHSAKGENLLLNRGKNRRTSFEWKRCSYRGGCVYLFIDARESRSSQVKTYEARTKQITLLDFWLI